MRTILLAAAAVLALGGTAMAQSTPGTAYEARATLGGFILRGGAVWGDKRMLDTGVRLFAGSMRPITNGFPKTVEAWGNQGTTLFNYRRHAKWRRRGVRRGASPPCSGARHYSEPSLSVSPR